MLDFGQFFDIMIFAVEHNDTQQYRSGHNEHDWKSCVRQKRTESSNLSCCARKSHHPTGWWLFFLNQRFEQGVSKAKKRPGGAFVTRCACRGVVTPRVNLSCCARKSTTQQGGAFLFESEIRTGCERSEKTPRRGVCHPLCVSRCGNTASESLLLRQKKHHPTGCCFSF